MRCCGEASLEGDEYLARGFALHHVMESIIDLKKKQNQNVLEDLHTCTFQQTFVAGSILKIAKVFRCVFNKLFIVKHVILTKYSPQIQRKQ